MKSIDFVLLRRCKVGKIAAIVLAVVWSTEVARAIAMLELIVVASVWPPFAFAPTFAFALTFAALMIRMSAVVSTATLRRLS